MGDFLGWNDDSFAGLGVSSRPAGSVDDMEGAESPELDTIPILETFSNCFQDDLDGFGCVNIFEVIFQCQGLDEF